MKNLVENFVIQLPLSNYENTENSLIEGEIIILCGTQAKENLSVKAVKVILANGHFKNLDIEADELNISQLVSIANLNFKGRMFMSMPSAKVSIAYAQINIKDACFNGQVNCDNLAINSKSGNLIDSIQITPGSKLQSSGNLILKAKCIDLQGNISADSLEIIQ